MDKEYKEFKELIEKMKEEKFDSEKTKEYILKIKRYFDNFMNNCEGEITKEEGWEEFLEKYDEEIKLRKTSTARMMYGISQYNACKVLLNLMKGNKSKFNNLVQQAKKLERETPNKARNLDNSLNTEEQLIVTLRNAIRNDTQMTEKGLSIYLKANKSHYEKILKEEFIKRIEESILYLNEYGSLDELLERVNSELEKLNLNEIKIRKRNPLPDEIYDKQGNVIKYDEKGKLCKYNENGSVIKDGEDLSKYEEDSGFMEILDKEYLQNLSVESLLLLDTFWRAKHSEERCYISNAIIAIKFSNLEEIVVYGDKEEIERIDPETISNALKRDKALTYIYGNVDKVTPKMKRQYTKFLKENNMDKKGSFEDDLKITSKEVENIFAFSSDVSLESCVIISKLMEKDFNVKNWGVLSEDDLGNGKKELGILVDSPDFRGPIFLGMPDNLLKHYFQTDNLNLPKVRKPEKVENQYNDIMSEICLPATEYFKKCLIKKYTETPSSELYAKLAGKKVKRKDELEY